LLIEVKIRRKDFLQIVGRKIRQRFVEFQVQRSAHSRLQSWRTSVLRRGGGLRLRHAGHFKVNAVAKAFFPTSAAVQINDNLMIVKFQLADLDVVARADRGAMRGHRTFEQFGIQGRTHGHDEAVFARRHGFDRFGKFAGNVANQRKS
jgi:environmental stress-induced protein Ves